MTCWRRGKTRAPKGVLGVGMTRYEFLLLQAKRCLVLANFEEDLNLKKFYSNASEGFKIKASKLSIEDAANLWGKE